MFRNLFLILVPEADPTERVVHADDLSETTIVPVPSTDAAVAEVAAFGQVDLIELYGGLGLDAAARIVALETGAAVGYAGDVTPAAPVAVLFEDPAPGQWTFGKTTIATVPSAADAPAAAKALVAEGATRVELCGGMGPAPAAEVRKAVEVPVTTVLFGFESLPAAADYRARYEQAVKADA